MADYYIGQIFDSYPPIDAIGWCLKNNATINEIKQDNKTKYQIAEQPQETPEEKQARIDGLTMTPLDFIGVLQTFGLTLPEINEFLESNLNIKMQLTYCNNVFCAVAKSFLPITVKGITITPAMVEQAFKIKNGVA